MGIFEILREKRMEARANNARLMMQQKKELARENEELVKKNKIVRMREEQFREKTKEDRFKRKKENYYRSLKEKKQRTIQKIFNKAGPHKIPLRITKKQSALFIKINTPL